jgi:iron(III) transport system ATP-binding protein
MVNNLTGRAYCLVQVTSPALGDQRLSVTLSPNFLAEQTLTLGSHLPLRLLPDRMRIFA